MLEDIGKQIIVEVAKEALAEPAKEIGNELADLLRILFTPLQMAKICRDAWLEDYKARILRKYSQIPESRKITPPLQIVGPAIEASRYFIQEETMRELFANLIAHSCDSKNAQVVHPAFVSFLTQMTPLEAELLQLFRAKTEFKIGMSISVGNTTITEEPSLHNTGIMHYPERYLPIVNYHLDSGSKRRTIYRNIMQIPKQKDINAISASISNLVRMGLIETTYTEALPESSYAWASQNAIHDQLIQCTKDGCSGTGVTIIPIRGNMLIHGTFDRLTIEKGIVHLTQLGFDFTKCCVIEQEVTTDDISD